MRRSDPIRQPNRRHRFRKASPDSSNWYSVAGLGFEHLCCYGEAFSLARFAFVLPAITVLATWFEGRPLRISKAGRSWHAIPCWSQETKPLCKSLRGRREAFYGFLRMEHFLCQPWEGVEADGPVMTKTCGRHVDRQITFGTFADVSRRETALL